MTMHNIEFAIAILFAFIIYLVFSDVVTNWRLNDIEKKLQSVPGSDKKERFDVEA